MDQTAPQFATPTIPTPIPPPVNNNPLNPPSFFKSKKFFIIAALMAAIIVLLTVSLLGQRSQKSTTQNPNSPQETPQTWQLTVTFDTVHKILSTKSLSLLDQTIRPDPRTTQDSAYTLYLLDNNHSILYKSKVNITEQLLFDYISATASAIPQPSTLDSVIYIPQYVGATDIKIINNSKLVLDTKLPAQKTSFVIPDSSVILNLFQDLKQRFRNKFGMTVNAQTSGHPLQIVFISDGFTDMNQFHQVVSQIEAKYNSVEPYASANPSIFDFQTVDNTTPFGCNTLGILYCLSQNQNLIYQIGYSHFPQAGKLVVITNSPNTLQLDHGTLGLTINVGGNIAIVIYSPNSIPNNITLNDATHEVLGHATGELYDRYVAKPPYPGLQSNIRSNCTDNPQGETFWSQAGATGAFIGCDLPTLYAPVAPSCSLPNTQNSNMTNAGTPNSVMSAVGCGSPTGFDLVEQWWIKNHIIPRYQQAVNASPNPTANPTTPTASTNPTTATSGNGNTGSNNGVVVQTDQPTEVTTTSILANGEVTAIPGGDIRIRNFQYYDTQNSSDVCALNSNGQPVSNPNCLYSTPNTPGQYQTGSFSKPIQGLTPGHTYAIRAYAVNDNNLPGYTVSLTGWGNWLTLTTPTSGLGTTGNNNNSSKNTNTGQTSFGTLTCTPQPSGVYTCTESAR